MIKKVLQRGSSNKGYGFWGALLLLVIWWTVCRLGIWSTYLLPSPEKILHTFLELCSGGELFKAILVSLQRVACGITFAFISAMLLGLLNGINSGFAAWARPMIHFLRNIPPLSIIPLLILWCGIGELSKVLLIFLSAFFPMFLNIEKGISGCERALLEVGKTFSFSKRKIFRYIVLPYAVPDILVGVRVGMGYSWRAIVGAEMIASTSGLGHLILDAQYMARPDRVIVVVLTIGTLGYLCDKLFALAIRHLPWNGEAYVGNCDTTAA